MVITKIYNNDNRHSHDDNNNAEASYLASAEKTYPKTINRHQPVNITFSASSLHHHCIIIVSSLHLGKLIAWGSELKVDVQAAAATTTSSRSLWSSL
jgi:hypothetical protein